MSLPVPRSVPALVPTHEVEAAQRYLEAEKAASTRRAYRTDWAHFTAWAAARQLPALPAQPETVALFLSAEADAGRKPSTVARRVAAIRYAHRTANLEPPSNAELVKAAMRGVRRVHGVAPTRKAPATAPTLLTLVAETPATLQGARDRALLLLGFAGAFRRSELVALRVEDVQLMDAGALVTIRRSKTDQEGVGRQVAILKGQRACPVAALMTWLAQAGISEGPLFRPVSKDGTVRPVALTPHSVGRVVKRAAARAGLNPELFGGHSLRAGFATSAVAAGANLFKVMDQTGHRRTDTLRGYVRAAEAFTNHAGAGLL